ncbi:GrxA family glutaredoxin [Marinobacter salinexigens]|uniref:GrxA family glutaredoxin n=1 Tax=Marinobacter salinexigens TaxID=2919747 RepID=A0A5B0VGI1_9GAMM|nr:GrxA family glutaredoxin [Marinobacter salinexigens]KAA1173171.1 GrxA family glutaredoxin [Marinobacter salinexigens]
MEQVTIYGRSSCGFCVRAKQLCEVKGMPYQWVDMIAENLTKEDIAARIGRPVYTVPQILVGSEYVGGCDEFMRWVRDHEAEAAR